MKQLLENRYRYMIPIWYKIRRLFFKLKGEEFTGCCAVCFKPYANRHWFEKHTCSKFVRILIGTNFSK